MQMKRNSWFSGDEITIREKKSVCELNEKKIIIG